MKRLTREGVRKAEGDWRVANHQAAYDDAVKDVVCLHCRQASEKCLKGLLQEQGVVAPRTHDLLHLLDLPVLAGIDLGFLHRGPRVLRRYAVDYRDPGFHSTARRADERTK